MSQLRFTISTRYRKDVEQQLKRAHRLGQVRKVKYLLAVLAVMAGQPGEAVARTWQVTPPTVQEWLRLFLCYGTKGAPRRKSSGRPAKLSPAQKAELARLIEAGPSAAGFSGACWRSPMVQQLIHDRFGVRYNVFYIAELLKNLGFSFQKAKFVSDHLDEVERLRWRTQTWPQILHLARAQGAWLLFGDEASFPQWGTLSYTWARRGQQPTVQTSGKRQGDKVFGLLDYFTGRFFAQGTAGRLTSASYTAFLQQVLAQTTQAIVLIQDGARYHTSAETRRFFAAQAARVTVFQLPAYSPDYHPIEKLWKKIKEHDTHLHYFATFATLTEKVEAALLKFENAPAEILALCSLPAELAKAA